MKVRNKTIIVTGGGNGMGRELTLNLLSKGARALAVDINGAALLETARLAGDKQEQLAVCTLNIADREALERFSDTTVARFGAVDGIINNAGIIQPFRKLNNLDFEMIDRIMNVDFFGMLNVTKIFLPALLSRPEAHIVNVSSMGGFLPVAGQTVYGASKAAVRILSEGLACELADTRVRVTTVIPGALYTNIKANSGLGAEAGAGTEGHAPDAAFSPAKAAELIVEAIEHERTRIYIGKDAKSMSLLYRLNPDFATKLVYKKIQHKI